jgi:hypothetical protein
MSEDRKFAPRPEINSEKTFAPRPEIKDLREFAKRTMERHEDMQAATRRQGANNRDVEVKRTYVTMEPPKAFAAQPQKIRKNAPQVAEGGSTSVESGAFYGIYTVASEGEDNGDIMLQGGQVTAGTGSEMVPNIRLYDFSASQWLGDWTTGEVLQLEITGEGDTADDVLMPVFNMDPAGYATSAVTAIADDILPEVGALSGQCNVLLGQFTEAGFAPSNVGSVQVSFCFGGFTRSRF